MIISKLDNGKYVKAGTIRLVNGRVVLDGDMGFFRTVHGADSKKYTPADGDKYITAVKQRFGHSKTIMIEIEKGEK
jgi:hypothetical protein